MGCDIRDPTSKLVASGYREGSLYYLDQGDPIHQVCLGSSSKETYGIADLDTWECQA